MGLGYSRRPMSPDSEPQSCRAGGRAGGRLRALRADDRRALVAARRRRRAGRARSASSSRSRTGRSTRRPRRSTSASRSRPDSAAAVTTSPTTLGLVQAFVTSEEAIEKAASAAGLRPSRLRDHVTVRADSRHVDHQAGVSGAAALDSGHGLLAREDGGRGEPSRAAGRGRGGRVHEDEDRHPRPAAQVHRHAARARQRSPHRRARFPEGDRRRSQPQPRREARRAHEPQLRDHARRAAPGDARAQPLQHDARALARQGHRGKPHHRAGGGRADGADEPADERPRRRLHRPPARDRGGAALGSGRGSRWQPAPPRPCSTARP